MKIGLLYESLGRSKGGVEAWLYHAAEALLQGGHSVCAFAMTAESSASDAMPAEAEIHYLGSGPPGRIPGLRIATAYRRFVKELDRVSHDVDVFWSRSYAMTLAGGRIARGRPVVFIQATPIPVFKRVAREGLRSGLLGRWRFEAMLKTVGWLEARAMRRATCLIYLSKSRCAETLAFYGDQFRPKCHVVPPGVNLQRFTPGDDHWTGDGAFRLLSVCRLSREKNLDVVLRAVALLARRSLPIEYTICGDGPEGEALRRLAGELGIASRVRFVGKQLRVEDYYRQAHLFVLPSIYEGFGAVYVEAMASGLPCLGLKNQPGRYDVAAGEIIEHERTGLLVEEDSPENIAAALFRAYGSPVNVRSWSVAARRVCEERYRWRTAVERLLGLTSSPSGAPIGGA